MNRKSNLAIILFTALLLCGGAWAQNIDDVRTKKDSSAFRYTYPEHIFKASKWSVSIPIWVPGFRGSFAYGDVEIDPGYGNEPPDSGTGIGGRPPKSDLSVSFYLIGKVKFQHERWLIEAEGMSATLDNDLTFVDSGLFDFGGTIDATILKGMIGYEFYRKENAGKLVNWSLWG